MIAANPPKNPTIQRVTLPKIQPFFSAKKPIENSHESTIHLSRGSAPGRSTPKRPTPPSTGRWAADWCCAVWAGSGRLETWPGSTKPNLI